jgi:hypothetical protein
VNETENTMTLDDLSAARNEAMKEVNDWMLAEGRQGNLRFNDQAPAWSKYEAAQKALDAALSAVQRT